jgi:hypothetical protein
MIHALSRPLSSTICSGAKKDSETALPRHPRRSAWGDTGSETLAPKAPPSSLPRRHGRTPRGGRWRRGGSRVSCFGSLWWSPASGAFVGELGCRGGGVGSAASDVRGCWLLYSTAWAAGRLAACRPSYSGSRSSDLEAAVLPSSTFPSSRRMQLGG